MKTIARLLLSQALIAGAAGTGREATFEVRQSVVLKEIPRGARSVRLWISIPDDSPAQRMLDFFGGVGPRNLAGAAFGPTKWQLI